MRAWVAVFFAAACGGPAAPPPTAARPIVALEARAEAPPPRPPPPRVEAMALGWEEGCALRADATVWCWRQDADPVAAPVAGIDDAVELSVYGRTSCARRRGGRVLCWGSTAGGRGAGHAVRSEPAEVEGIDDALTVVSDLGGACVLREGGAVACWGATLRGSSAPDHPEPVPLPAPIARLAHAPGYGFVARTADGRAFTWGMSQEVREGEPAPPTEWSLDGGVLRDRDGTNVDRFVEPIALGVGVSHACVLERDRGLACSPRSVGGEVRRVAIEEPRALGVHGYEACVLHGEASITCFALRGEGELVPSPLVWHEPAPAPVDPGPAVELALGDAFGCARHARGAVRCWGEDDRGQLGDGDPAPASEPRWVGGLDDAIAIAAGHSHACAVRADRTVACWGAGSEGELGLPPRDAGVPRPVEGVAGALAVAAAHRSTCALLESGRVRCWGAHSHGGGGRGFGPTDLPAISDAIAVALGYGSLAVVRRDGSLHLVGGVAGGPSRELAGASARSVAIDPGNGRRFCYARRDDVVCGREALPASAYAAGSWERCLIEGGRLRCGEWDAPLTAVTGLDRAVLSVAISGWSRCVILDDGSVRCWGAVSGGWLGDPIPGVEGAARVLALPDGGCALGEGGARCWGETRGADASVRALVDDGWCGIGARGAVTCAALGEEAPVLRGLPAAGASEVDLGDTIGEGCALVGTEARCWSGGRALRAERGVVAVAVTEDAERLRHRCVIDREARVRCTMDAARFEATGVEGAVELALGDSHGCARRSDGHVACWGISDREDGAGVHGQGGAGEHDGLVRGIDDATAIAAGGSATCAIRADRSVWCWGDLSRPGLFGDPRLRSVLSPVRVAGLLGVRSISVARDHGCALLEGGRARCWGARRADVLGDQAGAGLAIPLPR